MPRPSSSKTKSRVGRASGRNDPRESHQEFLAAYKTQGEEVAIFLARAMAATIASAMPAGLSATTIPAYSRAAIFSPAVPRPPEMIAPA
jgi:hypothetical protein